MSDNAHPRPHRAARRSVTLRDVAREAQVATSTVSRALNNPGRLSAETQEHVQRVAERMGYRGSTSTPVDAPARVASIALLVPELSNPYFMPIVQGAEREAAAAGRHLILSGSQQDARREAQLIGRLSNAVDGFVIAATQLPGPELQALAADRRMVVVNREFKGLTSVLVDPVAGPNSAVEHLASLGHRHIAYVSGPGAAWMNTQRWTAIQAAAQTRAVTVTMLGPFAATHTSGAAAADATVAERVSAAIAFNDLMAIGMLDRFRERGVSVPSDVSLVGFDDIYGAAICSPALTTLAAPLDELGRTSVRLLLESESGIQAPRSVVLPTFLIVRGSTGPAARRAARKGRIVGTSRPPSGNKWQHDAGTEASSIASDA